MYFPHPTVLMLLSSPSPKGAIRMLLDWFIQAMYRVTVCNKGLQSLMHSFHSRLSLMKVISLRQQHRTLDTWYLRRGIFCLASLHKEWMYSATTMFRSSVFKRIQVGQKILSIQMYVKLFSDDHFNAMPHWQAEAFSCM